MIFSSFLVGSLDSVLIFVSDDVSLDFPSELFMVS